MPISKRLRYEILRRDNHACRYCGASAPDVALTVDHVIPVALGGSDQPDNLVAACKNCNAGKSAGTPGAPLVADVAQDALRWRDAMHQASAELLDDKSQRDRDRQEFHDYWCAWSYGSGRHADPVPVPLDPGWERSVDAFVDAGLPMEVIRECVDIAMGNPVLKRPNVFRYMCGVAWNRITGIQERAREIANGA